MTPESIRVAIAQSLGYTKASYTDTYEGGSGRIRWKNPEGKWLGSPHDPADNCHLPNFPL